MDRRRNIAAAVGGWSVRHRVIAILGWVVFVVVAMTVGSISGQRQMTVDEYAKGDSAKAVRILDDAGLRRPAGEMILVTSDASRPRRPAVRAAVADLIARVRATGLVTELNDPYAGGLVSADKHSVLVRPVDDRRPDDRRRPGAADRRRGGRGRDRRTRPFASTSSATGRPTSGSTTRSARTSSGPSGRRSRWPWASCSSRSARFLAAVLPVGLALTSFLAANGAAGADQPPDAPRQLDQLGDAARRPGGRRRLLHVLPAPRARGARSRQRPARRRYGSRRRPPAARCWCPG